MTFADAPPRLLSARRALPFVPALAVALADAEWRVASALLGVAPDSGGTMVLPAELSPPWTVAAVTAVLGVWLLVRPGRLPAAALGALALGRLTLTALPLAAFAVERLVGWGMYDPAHPSPLSPWTELLHATLHAATAVLLAVGVVRFRAERRREVLAGTAEAF